MIPKLIHQTAKTADIPEQERVYQARLRALHPDWTYKLWTDEDNAAFVNAEYPDFADVFFRLPKNIMRADVIRYLLLYRLGGLYLDTDYEMLKPFDLNQHACVLPWESAGHHGPGKDRICNSIFASEPGHPFFKMVIDDLKAHPPLDANQDVIEATGPVFFTKILRRLSDEQIRAMDIHLPPRPLFSPPTPRSQRQHDAIVNEGVAYGIHHCHGSWREYTAWQKLRNHLSHWAHQLVG
jgi:mannosyltransferase OCH1-like enzyme